jgi:hypothetical protein
MGIQHYPCSRPAQLDFVLSFGSADVTLRGMAGWRHVYGDRNYRKWILLKFLHCWKQGSLSA